MTVSGLKEALNLAAFALPQGQRQVCGGYAGDLLSWVMGKAEADDAWLTIMSNPNIIAVANVQLTAQPALPCASESPC